jgi:hypothetical protein
VIDNRAVLDFGDPELSFAQARFPL